jgi:hypothetical protein
VVATNDLPSCSGSARAREEPLAAIVDTLSFTVLSCSVRVQCEDPDARDLLAANYGCMQGGLGTVSLDYAVSRPKRSSAFLISRAGQKPLRASDGGEFLFVFEKDLTIQLQQLRPDLYFIHSAVLEFAGRAIMLVAASGSGKSMTTWALLHHGFRYLSDELGPVDLETLQVYPYPHALCLKEKPPGSYPLPQKTLYMPHSLHVPTTEFPSGVSKGPVRLAALFFLRYQPRSSGPVLRSLSGAEAGARLFAQALNPLAHAGDGLDGAIAIATKCVCFELVTADLSATCALLRTTLSRWSHHRLSSSRPSGACSFFPPTKGR